MTVCELEKSFISENTVEIVGYLHFFDSYVNISELICATFPDVCLLSTSKT